jgi:hypothetical protein
MRDEASYVCDSCGEKVVLPIDLSAASEQESVEDCPVCCCPNVIHVEVDEGGDVRAGSPRTTRPFGCLRKELRACCRTSRTRCGWPSAWKRSPERQERRDPG